MARQNKYLGNLTFQGSAQGGSFAEHSIQIPDIGPELRRRREDLFQDYEYLHKSGLRDLELTQERDNVRIAHNNRMLEIQDSQHVRFIEQLSKTAYAYGQQKIEEEILDQQTEGALLHKRLTEMGITTEKYAAFLRGDEQIKSNEIGNAKIVGGGLKDLLDTSTLREIENMGFFKRRSLTENFLKHAASRHAGDMQELSNKSYQLPNDAISAIKKRWADFPITDEEGNPRTYALTDKDLQGKAWSPQIRAVIKTQMDKDYLSRFDGISSNMLNRYLFGTVIKNQQHADQEFATAERKRFIQDRVDTSYNNLHSSLISNQGSGESFLREIEILSNYLGSRGAAANKLWEEVLDGVDKGVYDESMIESLKAHKFIHHQTGKETTIGENWEAFLTREELDQRLIKGQNDKIQLKKEEVENADAQLAKELVKVENERIANGEPPLTQADLLHIARLFNDEHGLAPGNQPESIKNYLTNQTREGMPLKEWLEYKRVKNGGVLTQEDLKGVPITMQATYRQQGLVEERPNQYTPNQSELADINEIVEAAVREKFGMEGDDKLSPAAVAFKKRAERDALKIWTQARVGGASSGDAWEKVNSEIPKKATQIFSPYSTRWNKSAYENKIQTYKSAKEFLKKSGNSTTLIPNTENQIKELEKWVERGGGEPLPEFYRHIAYGQKGWDAWQFAADQYKAAGKGDLIEPSIVKEVKGLTITEQDLLNNFPSLSKSLRVINNNTEHDRDENIANNFNNRAKQRNIASYRPSIKSRKFNINSNHWSNQPNVLLPSLGGTA
tara:strand:+ start:2849 stop:5206 length:2358 start_codon:yes stop_codon:yes gene_type:complete